jgi:hypothetical protein
MLRVLYFTHTQKFGSPWFRMTKPERASFAKAASIFHWSLDEMKSQLEKHGSMC